MNFWRDTDPIATEIDFAWIENVQLPDPAPHEKGDALVHSDYRIDRAQLSR